MAFYRIFGDNQLCRTFKWLLLNQFRNLRWPITATVKTKRNTANNENFTNKNALLTYEKVLLPYKQDLLTYAKKDLLTNTKKPWQITSAISCGKFSRQIVMANFCVKFPRQISASNSRGKQSREIPAANSHGKILQQRAFHVKIKRKQATSNHCIRDR